MLQVELVAPERRVGVCVCAWGVRVGGRGRREQRQSERRLEAKKVRRVFAGRAERTSVTWMQRRAGEMADGWDGWDGWGW